LTKLSKFEELNVDLDKLAHQVRKLLEKERFKIVKDDRTENAIHMRAVKSHITRIVIGTARDVEIVIAGDPDNFAVILIVGAWGKNMAISAATGFVVASTLAAPAVVAGTVLAAGSYLTAVNFEEKLFDKIETEVHKLGKTSMDCTTQASQ